MRVRIGHLALAVAAAAATATGAAGAPAGSRRLLVVAALAAASFAPTAAAAPGDPQARHTAADSAFARSVLLEAGDVGAGWKAAPASASPNAITCPSVRPNESDLVQTGLAARSFSQGQDRQIAQAVRVFKTNAQANRAWERTVTVGLLVCDEQRIEQSNMHIKVTQQFRLVFPRVAPHTAGFRITAVARSADGKKITARLYVDLLLLGRGKTIATAVFTSAGKPLARPFEEGIARALAQRLGARPVA